MATYNEVKFYRGEDIPIRLTIDPTKDITGWNLLFQMIRTETDNVPLVEKTMDDGIVIDDGENGRALIMFESADSINLSIGEYFADVKRIDPGYHRVVSTVRITIEDPVREF